MYPVPRARERHTDIAEERIYAAADAYAESMTTAMLLAYIGECVGSWRSFWRLRR